MISAIYVMLGGAFGALGRFVITTKIPYLFHKPFPYSIFLVNILGCFFMGIIAGLIHKHVTIDNNLRLFIATGFLGGFTTFSAFANDAVKYIMTGEYLAAIIYMSASVIISLLFLIAGMALTNII
jgi:CrcB protein